MNLSPAIDAPKRSLQYLASALAHGNSHNDTPFAGFASEIRQINPSDEAKGAVRHFEHPATGEQARDDYRLSKDADALIIVHRGSVSIHAAFHAHAVSS